jgi:hypothetical protein
MCIPLLAARSNSFTAFSVSVLAGGFWCEFLVLFLACSKKKKKNKNMETAEANVIYLETPAGVGYSYSADAAYYQGVDDKMTGTCSECSIYMLALRPS